MFGVQSHRQSPFSSKPGWWVQQSYVNSVSHCKDKSEALKRCKLDTDSSNKLRVVFGIFEEYLRKPVRRISLQVGTGIRRYANADEDNDKTAYERIACVSPIASIFHPGDFPEIPLSWTPPWQP